MQTKKHEIQRSNLLIEANYNIPSVDGYRITLIGMSGVCMNLLNNPLDDKALTVSIKTKDLIKLFPAFKKAGSSIHQRIDHATDAIGSNNTVRIINKDSGNWEKIPFIMNFKYIDFDTLIIRFNEEIRHLFNPESKFTRYLLNDTAELSSYQQIRIYELLIQYIKIRHRKINIQELKKFIGINKNKTTSKLIQELKACIVQINKKTNLEVEFETIKTSRKITHVKFKFCRTDLHPLDEINNKENNLKTQLIDLGFKQEKLKSLLKISPEVLIQAIHATKKVKQGQGFKKTMEACFFYQIRLLKDNENKKLTAYEIVCMFKENSGVRRDVLWSEFYAQLSEEQKLAYSPTNREKNKTVKEALDNNFNNKYNKWIYETKIKQQ